MSVGDVTAILIALSALLGAIFTFSWNRSQTRRQAILDAQKEEEREKKDEQRRMETSGVTLTKINDSISKERDRAVEALDEQTKRHKEEIDRLRREHNQEIEDLRARFDAESRQYAEQIAALSKRLAACQKTVDALYRELYELQKLIPVELRPPFPQIPPSE